MERLTLPDIDGLFAAWEHTPPQAVSLHWLREMMAAYLGVKTNDGPKAPPVPMTDKAKAWLEATLEEMGGMQSPVVFETMQNWEVSA